MPSGTASFDKAPGDETEFPIRRDAVQAAPLTDEDDYFPDLFEAEEDPAATRAAGKVAWARNDRLSPCYSHLLLDSSDRVVVDKSFEIGKAEIELLIALNRYQPRGKNDIIAFGLRGARLRGEESFEEVERLLLDDARPDHLNYRCVVGYYFRATGKFSAFTGSTVPWQGYMAAGTIKYNLLSPGCYIYKKGTHMPATRSRWVTPALRLSDAEGAHSGEATVLRNKRDLAFEVTDTWDYCSPADNIHCAYSNSKFSSLGCQTIKGGMNDGLWADFAATLRTLPEGARVDYVMFTGAEASLAASLVKAGKSATDPEALRRLGRLRVGSMGDEVKRLQARLGAEQTGYLGPATKKKLVDFQAANGFPADGVYSPAIDKKLGWNVLAEHAPAEAPAVAAPAVAAPASAAVAVATPAAVPSPAPTPSPAVAPPTPPAAVASPAPVATPAPASVAVDSPAPAPVAAPASAPSPAPAMVTPAPAVAAAPPTTPALSPAVVPSPASAPIATVAAAPTDAGQPSPAVLAALAALAAPAAAAPAPSPLVLAQAVGAETVTRTADISTSRSASPRQSPGPDLAVHAPSLWLGRWVATLGFVLLLAAVAVVVAKLMGQGAVGPQSTRDWIEFGFTWLVLLASVLITAAGIRMSRK